MAAKHQMTLIDRVLFLASIAASCAIVFGVALIADAVIEEHGEPHAVALHLAGRLPGHVVVR
jgi:ABC-type hemin transport system substrate-binding protein